MANNTSPILLTRTHRILIGVVVAGAVVIAAIGFAGSYAAVRELAQEKGFGDFSLVFPIGIDAGICVLLALDLLLTWMRIPFPLLRQTAWLLTAATIAFNGAASWPDPLGVGMHAVIPVLFVVSVEAARHAVGRIADITADKHMEGVRLTRWLLSPLPTFKLWRRMKLWELRSYEQVIKLEQDRLIYQARLQARFGRGWRRKAPIESLMPLRLAKYGIPLADTAPAGLAAAGIEPALLPPAPQTQSLPRRRPQEGQQQRPHEVPELPLPAQQQVRQTSEVAAATAVEHDVIAHTRAQEPEPAAQDEPTTDPAKPVEPVTDLAELVTDDRPVASAMPGVTDDRQDVAPHPFFGPPSQETGVAQPTRAEPYVREPVRGPIASAAESHRAGGGVHQQSALDVYPGRTADAPVDVPLAWEASVTETGAATVRLPEQQSQEPEMTPVRHQIATVAEWLADAEATGQRLSGAEVARRLGLSPKTGQRRVNAATEYLEEQRRQQGRAHLRSVGG
ncbi:DUF2637 domain-containing protein [Streptomyces agglomeratus]|uniref:DUF2637 domain-containing protein n=1 Tax=Streptomyces agglomeratus TaxID=285458 RepID=UPI000854648E|nr:DUF2637 domain-containing protein [Streptomyces agglomeratus]OEJ36378.1 hypothetical protein BGK72_38975 [Streptomyces agglomeratus]